MTKDIKFGYIAPINYLHLIPEDERFHLILAHLLGNEQYVNFYKQKRQRGDVVLLDNACYEFKRPLSAEEIFAFIDRSGIEPTHVVAPDYVFSHWMKTWESTLQFIQHTKHKPYKIMAVPQSIKGDVNGWIECYTKMLNHPDIDIIGMSIMGVPNAFCEMTGTEDIATNRLFAADYLIRNKIVKPGQKWHHFLGQGGGPNEILLQRRIGLIDSNDSSGPIWAGINGIRYDWSASGLKDGKVKKEVDFNIEYDEDTQQDIAHNINYFKNIILA